MLCDWLPENSETSHQIYNQPSVVTCDPAIDSAAVNPPSRPYGRLVSHHFILPVDVHSELVQRLQRLAMESAEIKGGVVQTTVNLRW